MAAISAEHTAQQHIHDEQQLQQGDEEDRKSSPTMMTGSSSSSSFRLWSVLQVLAAVGFLFSAFSTIMRRQGQQPSSHYEQQRGRRLAVVQIGDTVPSYMNHLLQDLQARTKLMQETPPDEVKYWFEYTGPLQKYFYRFSKSRQKTDYFEGRDDSGVTSARFIEEPGAGSEFVRFYDHHGDAATTATIPDSERSTRARLLENCLAMGAPARPDVRPGTIWHDWFGQRPAQQPQQQQQQQKDLDRCRILVTLNMVGAGRGSTMLWETNPPLVYAQGPIPWTSEQETAATHLERNLKEMDHMCATGLIAVRVQVLVCEPIPAKWTEWMDSMLVHCGGKPAPMEQQPPLQVEERPSPVQIVVMANAATADTCHDLKSGFMEKRMQDLILAPPYLGDATTTKNKNPTTKTTHPDLISSDDHDLYVAIKWSSLVTIRAIHAFLQASADLAAAAASPLHQVPPTLETNADGNKVAVNVPASPFLIPSFVRVSYVSEENSKVAKWRMHGDFFHPAAWEVCKDSFDVTWIPHSLSGAGGVNGLCYGNNDNPTATSRKLLEGEKEECGQWWVYFSELQMPTSPEVYANEVTPPLVHGGSNYVWMVTERQRRELVKIKVCEHTKDDKTKCPAVPQAVMPLGDLESFLINYTPNTALGKRHILGRRPGYSREKERELEREKVRERKQLKDQDDIERALFEYTIYPAALFRKDATIKAARARDVLLTKNRPKEAIGPQTIKSSYYDVTITKPRQPIPSWCQAIARKGLCTLYGDYFRTSTDARCLEACGMKKNWSVMEK